jgi:glycosyltransferase involved in cell wall biosynthesis
MPKKILFVSHNAVRTGAPLWLLRFLQWFKYHGDFRFDIILQNGGQLLSEFENIAPTNFLLAADAKASKILARDGVLGKWQQWKAECNQLCSTHKRVDLIYFNSIASIPLIEALSGLKCPKICHVHELQSVIRKSGGARFDGVREIIDAYVASSLAVKDNLMRHHRIPANKIHVVHSSISPTGIHVRKSRGQILQELNLPKTAFIVCMVGSLDWHKAPDIFVQLAMVTRRSEKSVYFIWIGAGGSATIGQDLSEDLDKAGLRSAVFFVGEKADPYSYLAASDVFCLVSREDSFPLVMLEAGYLGKPTIGFKRSGGVSEFIRKDSGFLVSYLDVQGMSEKIRQLFHSRTLLRRMGQRSKDLVKEKYVVEVQAPKILKIIRGFL